MVSRSLWAYYPLTKDRPTRADDSHANHGSALDPLPVSVDLGAWTHQSVTIWPLVTICSSNPTSAVAIINVRALPAQELVTLRRESSAFIVAIQRSSRTACHSKKSTACGVQLMWDFLSHLLDFHVMLMRRSTDSLVTPLQLCSRWASQQSGPDVGTWAACTN